MDKIILRVQASHTVTLKSLGTAGYQWSATVDDPLLVQVERIKAVPETAPVLMPGRSLAAQFILHALASGETMVHFTQARSFAPDEPPLASYDISVQVTSG